jgi:hypothetical protein
MENIVESQEDRRKRLRRESNARYYAQNQAELLEKRSAKYAQNKESAHDYYVANAQRFRERRKATSRSYYRDNREAILATSKEERLANLAEYLVRNAKGRAKKRSIAFSLTSEWAKSTYTGRCELSGVEFKPNSGRPGLYSASLDQIEAGSGYVPCNARFIVTSLNAMKGAGTDDDVFTLVKSLLTGIPKRHGTALPLGYALRGNLLGAARARARKNGLAFSLDREWIDGIWKGVCSVSGLAFEMGSVGGGFYSPSIDRIDPALGYVPENCRIVLLAYNRAKLDRPDSEVLELIQCLSNFQNLEI